MQSTGWDDGLDAYGMYGVKWGMTPSEFSGEPLVPETPLVGMTVYKVKTRGPENDLYYFKDGKIFAKRMVFTGLRMTDSVDNILETLKRKYGGYTQATETIEGLTWTHWEWNEDVDVIKAVKGSPKVVSIHFRFYISPTEGPSYRHDRYFFPGEKIERLSYGELFYVFYPRSPSDSTPAKTPAKKGK
jgi:hypothetical protein